MSGCRLILRSRRLIVAIEIRQRRITSARDKKQSSIGFIDICYT
jgi:hypothetical protein